MTRSSRRSTRTRRSPASFSRCTTARPSAARFAQMLPDHAGGVFETVTQGSRATARFLADPGSPFADMGGWGFWLQQVAWGTSKDLGDTAAYDISGWGAAGGAELKLGGAGQCRPVARLSRRARSRRRQRQRGARPISMSSALIGGASGAGFGPMPEPLRHDRLRRAALFTGRTALRRSPAPPSASGTASFTRPRRDCPTSSRSGRLNLRPAASLDYYRLTEDGYSETGGGDAFNLVVDEPDSDELAGDADLPPGYDSARRAGTELDSGRDRRRPPPDPGRLARRDHRSIRLRHPFTLLPEERSDGWLGRLRLLGGNPGFSLGGEASAEEQFGKAAVAFRVSLQIGI